MMSSQDDSDKPIDVGGSGAAASQGGVAAGAGGVAVGRDVHGPVIVAGQGAQVTVTVQGENLRAKEMAYLDNLLARYAYWRDHYTPLAGIAEVRAAVKDGPRLDLPMPFIPPGFEKLEKHGYGERAEIRRVPVADLRAAVAEQRRIVLLGELGSGKTTTLWRLVYDYATRAKADGQAPLPVLVPLGGYTDETPFDLYLGQHLGPLAPYLETYRASGRLILLLDGLNEMPQRRYAERVGRIQAVLNRQPEETVAITCRALDYGVKLSGLQPVEISPLDPERMHAFLGHYLGQTAGERLFWAMAGDDEVRTLWATWQSAGGTFAEFWTAAKMPENVISKTSRGQVRLWERLRQSLPPLLGLGQNPYLLLMTAQIYARAEAQLPANRARLFAAFVDVLLEREHQKPHSAAHWLEAETQVQGLAALAYAMQVEGERGTTVERTWAVGQLQRAVPACDPDRLLYLTSSATLLDTTETRVRFYHQLLQEYFAARALGRQVAAGLDLAPYWPAERWWEPSGWEETAILLAGVEASPLLAKLTPLNPILAGRCLVEGEAEVDEATRQTIITGLIVRMTDPAEPVQARAKAGDTLARLGDPRPGVGLRADGLPDIAWCEVPEGPFFMGSDKHQDGVQAYPSELPQYLIALPTFKIARYPITRAQFFAFVQDGGYTEQWRKCWTEAGWQWKANRSEPSRYGGAFDLPNHPVAGVSWYEAVAFGRWLTARLRQAGELEVGQVLTLPSEAEWEKAARGTDGRIYPWGSEADPDRANYIETNVGATTAVGCFPGGASPYGNEELSGNVWEWCRTKWQASYRDYKVDDDGLEGEVARVVRGGSFGSTQGWIRCPFRLWVVPQGGVTDLSFRLMVSCI